MSIIHVPLTHTTITRPRATVTVKGIEDFFKAYVIYPEIRNKRAASKSGPFYLDRRSSGVEESVTNQCPQNDLSGA